MQKATSENENGRMQWIQAALASYEAPLTRYAQRILRDADGARDVVQETFVRLCRARPEEINGPLAAWLFTVCRNQALSVRRKEDRMTTLTEVCQKELEAPVSAPDLTAQRRETAGRVADRMERLPQNQRTVIRLKFQHALSYREIAEATGLSVTNVGFLIHSGLKTLRRQMREET